MQLTVRAVTPAHPEHVYAALAHIKRHGRWAGEDQLSMFGLVEVAAAPDRPAEEGDTWSSQGRIPMHRQRWQDTSRVSVARPSRCFEYVTEAEIARSRGRSPRRGTYRHRYEIQPNAGTGALISYTITEERFAHPLLRVAIPGLRTLTWATGVRLMARRGLTNIVRMACEQQTPAPV